MPPHMNRTAPGQPSAPETSRDQQAKGDRIDSPLENSYEDLSRIGSVTPLDAPGLSTRLPASMPPRQAAQSGDSSDFRFMIVTNPDQLKNKHEVQKNRRHVMKHFLDQERKKAVPTDPRVTGQHKSGKRRRTEDASSQTSVNPAAPRVMFDHNQITPSSSALSSSSRHTSEEVATRYTPPRKTSRPSGSAPRRATSSIMVNQSAESSEDDQTLVPGLGLALGTHGYLVAEEQSVPWPMTAPSTRLGSPLNPFDTWPTFSDPSVNVAELKWNCSRHFGSRGITRHWIPTILRARHAFLSTICISSAHDDIMSRASNRRDERKALQRILVRQEVNNMIQESLKDPKLSTADATIVAILHVLNSEIIGCDDGDMRIHQHGLLVMIRQRGGLAKLGVNGQLASFLTTTNYLIAALRESTPHTDYVEYASQRNSKPPADNRPLPESPFYHRSSGYMSIYKVVRRGSYESSILEQLRKMTNAFLLHHRRPGNRNPWIARQSDPQDNVTSVAGLRASLFAFPPARELGFLSDGERYTYEAIRLASRIYSHALEKELPFSEAAQQLRTTEPASQDGLRSPPMHVRIKDALMKTDTSDCWGGLIGVLYWITLLASAAANPQSPAAKGGPVNNRSTTDDEEARRWLAAVTVRCSIVLGFDYGRAVLETLKNMVAIQDVLAKEPRPAAESTFDSVPAVPLSAGAVFGPREPWLPQRGFADYAQDFLGM